MGTATKQQKKVPELRFAGYSKEWQKKKLSDVAKIQRGRFSPRPRNDPKYYGGSIPFVQTSDVVNSGGYITKYTQTLNEEGLKVSKLFPKGNILITIAANIGYTGVLAEAMACPDSLIGISPNEDTSNFFLNYYLSTKREHMDRVASQAAQKNINIEFLNPYPVVVPELKEQQKIADFLGSVDTWLDNLRQQKTALETYKRGMMQKLFTQQFRFKDDNGNSFPAWKEKRLGDIGEVVTGTTPSTSVKKYYGGEFPWVTPTDIKDSKDISVSAKMLTKEGLNKGRFVSKNSLLVTCIASIGKNAILRVDGSCNQQINSITPHEDYDVDYLYYLLTISKNELIKHAGAGAMQMLNKKDFSSIKLSFPSLDEQQKIADFLTALDQTITAKAEKINHVEQWKKGLMQKMFV